MRVADIRTTFSRTPATSRAIIKDRSPSVRALVADRLALVGDRSPTSRRLVGDHITCVADLIPILITWTHVRYLKHNYSNFVGGGKAFWQ